MTRQGFVEDHARQLVETLLPTDVAEFRISLFEDCDGLEHLALRLGDVGSGAAVLTRVHSECLTGDVLGSRRCDCGAQLREAMRRIAAEGCGLILYLRQEGRGIGLSEKLKSYNLQDVGYDTVDANIALGHESDARDYTVAASMLKQFGVGSVRLLTNNPKKISGLEQHRIQVQREALALSAHADNVGYLQTKAERMGHFLAEAFASPDSPSPTPEPNQPLRPLVGGGGLEQMYAAIGSSSSRARPFLTIAYAQSLDGCLAAISDRPLALSGAVSMALSHRLRASHDAIIVGIGTVLADNPRLTARTTVGEDPQPVILDSRLRLPIDANLLRHPTRKVWVVTTNSASVERAVALEARGAVVIRVVEDAIGRVDFEAALAALSERGVETLMLEGGSRLITQCVQQQIGDLMIITIAPRIVGGVRAVRDLHQLSGMRHAKIRTPSYVQLDEDLVVWGPTSWSSEAGAAAPVVVTSTPTPSPQPAQPRRFVIVTAGRTGSNWLCSLLDSHTEILCHHELFNDQGVHYARSLRPKGLALGDVAARDGDPLGFLARVWQQPRGAAAVGFKLCPDQPRALLDAVLADSDVRKVVLARKNLVKMFVSRKRAELTGRWESYPESPRGINHGQLIVDPAELFAYIAATEAFYAALERRLTDTLQPVFRLDYESLHDSQELERLQRYLGVSLLSGLSGVTSKQTNDDLRAVIRNFDEVEIALRNTPLHYQLLEQTPKMLTAVGN